MAEEVSFIFKVSKLRPHFLHGFISPHLSKCRMAWLGALWALTWRKLSFEKYFSFHFRQCMKRPNPNQFDLRLIRFKLKMSTLRRKLVRWVCSLKKSYGRPLSLKWKLGDLEAKRKIVEFYWRDLGRLRNDKPCSKCNLDLKFENNW